MNKKLDELEKQYTDVTIPKELDAIVLRSIQKHKQKKPAWKTWGLGSVAAALVFTVSINLSPVMAKSLAEVPVLGNVISVLTFKSYTVEDGTYTAHIDVPKITTENNSALTTLNEQYREEAEARYEQFLSDIEGMQKLGEGGHLGVDSGYEVLTDTDQLLSISRYTVETVGSSSTIMKYDTIDKKNELLITLPSLFKDNSYISIISEYIAEQMRQQMISSNQEKIYWISDKGLSEEGSFEQFQQIKADQSFYITENGKLIISFDKYEVAPGYMGIPTFEIPTELIQNVLVSSEYIHE